MPAVFPPYDHHRADRVFRWSLLLAVAVHGLVLYRWPIWERKTPVLRPEPVLKVTLAPAPQAPARQPIAVPQEAPQIQPPPGTPLPAPHRPAPAIAAAPAVAPPQPVPRADRLRHRFLQAVRASPWRLAEPPDAESKETLRRRTPPLPAIIGWMTPLLPTIEPGFDVWRTADGALHKVAVLPGGRRLCGQAPAANPLEPFLTLPLSWHDCGVARGVLAATGDPWQRPAPPPHTSPGAPQP